MEPLTAARAPRLPAWLVVVAVVTAVLSGCTTGSPPRSPLPASPAAELVGAAATSTPAAELQAGLTGLLVERTYAVAALTDARDAEHLQALEDVSAAIAEVLGASYATAREPLRASLQRVDQLLAEHADALAAGDRPAAQQVVARLAVAHDELARVVRRVVPQLDAPEVAQHLAADVEVQRAVEARDGARLRELAAAAAGTARLLADGIAQDRRLGEVATPAARLRADLTALLTEHTVLMGALAREPVGDGQPQPSRVALDSNAAALAALLAESYPAARASFARSWAGHLDRLHRYAAARAAGDSGTAEAAVASGYAGELARLLAEHVDDLPATTALAELEPALQALLAALEAAGTPAGPAALRVAVAEVLPATALLSAAVAEDLRLG